jgi:hypothetical protein
MDDVKKSWLEELETFIARWEQETQMIQAKTLDLEECHRISHAFYEDEDVLLVKRPPGVSDDVFLRLEELENKLNSTLAMVCVRT